MGPFSGPRATGVPKREQNVTTLSGGWFPTTFSGTTVFVGPGPTGRKRWFSGISARSGLGHLEKFRARAENTKVQSPGARGTLGGGKSGRPKGFSPKLCNLFTFSVLAARTLRGGKSQNRKSYSQHTARCTYRGLVGTKKCTILGALILCTQIKFSSMFGSTNNRQVATAPNP